MTKYIELTQGKIAIVDDEDFEQLIALKWYFTKTGKNRGYAVHTQWLGKKIYMHRLLMHPNKGECVDHINGDTLDCRKNNLRICVQSENMRNQIKQSGKSSQFKGVRWSKRDKRWSAQITYNYKDIYLGYFTNEKEAAIAYNNAALLYFGKFSRLNEVNL